MQVLRIINLCIGAIFLLCYLYQIIYLFIAYIGGIKRHPDASPKKYAVLIAARNESGVIKNLLDSLNAQDYPKEFYKVFVVADNCTDNTAEVARECGAIVYERSNQTEKGKGYALDYLIKSIERDYADDLPDAYIVFDADNVAVKSYITEMNKTFSAGYEVVTSYRNASNYGAGWRAAGQGMYFIRDARVLNLARMRIKGSTFVSGTGFLFSQRLCEEYGGWPFHTLTEDGEFTMHNAVRGVKGGYCHDAVFYDEQAVDLKTSWYQRLRWCKGGLQIFRKYLPQLMRGIFSHRILSCFDMMMCLTPAYVLSISAVVINAIASVILVLLGVPALEIAVAVGQMILGAYASLFLFSLFITISDWKRIRASGFKKILYMFTFPLFIFSFIIPAFVALFKRVEWKPVRHSGEVSDMSKDELESLPQSEE